MAENGNTMTASSAEPINDKQIQSPVKDIEFQASQVISRLEASAVKAEDGGGGSSWSIPPGFLPPPGKNPDQILNLIEDLIVYEYNPTHETVLQSSEENELTNTESPSRTVALLPQLDSIARLSIVSQSIASYIGLLDRIHLQKLTTRIISDSTRWLGHLFKFVDCAAHFHEDALDGLVRIARLVIHLKYPRYVDDGFEALTNRPPVIYSSVSSPLAVVQHVCRQLGLPMHCVRPVPCNTVFGSQQTMDVSALERLMEEDHAAGRIPLMVLADAGTNVTGHVDNILRLQQLCKERDVWLHLRGHALAALALAQSPKLPKRLADSLTLPLGVWLGIPALPVVTLYRLLDSTIPNTVSKSVGSTRESTLPLIAGLTTDHYSRKPGCLALWAGLQALGREGLQERLKNAFEVAEHIWSSVQDKVSLRILSPKPGGESGSYSIAELCEKPLTASVLFEVIACTVVFQFVPVAGESTTANDETNTTTNSIQSSRVPSYYDKLNTWLGQILQRDCPSIPLEICDLESHGVVLRVCPLESSPTLASAESRLPTHSELDSFTSNLRQHLDILRATAKHKASFQRLVSANSRLRIVDMAGWAGLGGVRYVPQGWDQVNVMTDQAKEELNSLNAQLVHQLRATDQAFSIGEGSDGLVCVRFGMVTDETDVEELLGLVVTIGKEVEESSKFLDNMAEIVKKGIEAATLDLQRENEERLWQDGILRHVPVFGSLVNWWSPPIKEPGGVKGRSLNLQAGVIESTENIYRYHMQLQQTASNEVPPTSAGTRAPPPLPQVQTPIGAPPPVLAAAAAAAKQQQHSRSSSHSSQQSQLHHSATPGSEISYPLTASASSVPATQVS